MRLLLVCLFLVGGCHRGDDDDLPPPRVRPDLSAQVFDLAPRPQSDGGVPTGLGSGRARPAASTPLHVGPNQSANVPDGEYGFTVTANGSGGWRVAWADAAQL